MSQKKFTEDVVFRPMARLLYILGSDLIKDEMAGILELVKNSYDADAKCVRISFLDLQTEDSNETYNENAIVRNPCLIIEDTGNGMSKEVLTKYWMSPATDAKEVISSSPGGRPVLGKKGVGRFSAMRLGEELEIITIPSINSPKAEQEELGMKYSLNISWDIFLNSEKYLDEVPVKLVSTEKNINDVGTKLIINKLNDEWNESRINQLFRELRLLLSPIDTDYQNEFTITLDLTKSGLSNEVINRYSKEIEPYDIPEISDYLGKLIVRNDGTYRFEYRRELFKEIDQEEIENIIDFEQNQDIRDKFDEGLGKRFPIHDKDGKKIQIPCGPLEIDFFFWDRDTELLKTKAEKIKEVENIGIRSIRRLLDELSGVAIYRDGFGVRPFGDKDYDWLNLGQRRVQNPTKNIGPNQVFGIVKISSQNNPNLDDKASREGLKENAAYRVLQASILAYLSWMENLRGRFRKKHGLGRPDAKSTKALVDTRKKAFENLKNTIIKDVQQAELKSKLDSLVELAEDASNEEHDRFELQTRILHDNHALGLLARFVLHEGQNMGAVFDAGLNNIKSISKKSRTQKNEILISENNTKAFDRNLVAVLEASKRFDVMLERLDPITKSRRGRRSIFVVEKVIKNAIDVVNPELQEQNIKISKLDTQHRVLAWEADVFHAIYNLLINSIYWLIESKNINSRKIEIVILQNEDESKERKEVIINVVDNGPGISEISAPSIFDLGYTEKTNGRGAGLFIAREAIERSGGTIILLNPGEKGANFQIILEGDLIDDKRED